MRFFLLSAFFAVSAGMRVSMSVKLFKCKRYMSFPENVHRNVSVDFSMLENQDYLVLNF